MNILKQSSQGIVLGIFIAVCGCASGVSPEHVPINNLKNQTQDVSGKLLYISGYFRWTILGPLLYPTHKEALKSPEDESIDVVRENGTFSMVPYINGEKVQCVKLLGYYKPYKKNSILLDTRSKYGQFIVIKRMNCARK